MGKQFLAVDLGTTSIKAAVLDLGRLTFGTRCACRRLNTFPRLVGTRRELDPRQVIAEVRRLLCECLRAAPAANGSRRVQSDAQPRVRRRSRQLAIECRDLGGSRAAELTGGRARTMFDELRSQFNADEQHEIGGELRIRCSLSTRGPKDGRRAPAGLFATSLPDFTRRELVRCGTHNRAD